MRRALCRTALAAAAFVFPAIALTAPAFAGFAVDKTQPFTVGPGLTAMKSWEPAGTAGGAGAFADTLGYTVGQPRSQASAAVPYGAYMLSRQGNCDPNSVYSTTPYLITYENSCIWP